MLIKINLMEECELGDLGTVYLDTQNQEFIEEIIKYKCPIRLAHYMTEYMANPNCEVKELIRLEENQKIDLFLNLSQRAEEIINDLNNSAISSRYIEQTSHLYDKYGVVLDSLIKEYEELKKENEELYERLWEYGEFDNDMTNSSDRGYEMNLDRELYHN